MIWSSPGGRVGFQVGLTDCDFPLPWPTAVLPVALVVRPQRTLVRAPPRIGQDRPKDVAPVAADLCQGWAGSRDWRGLLDGLAALWRHR